MNPYNDVTDEGHIIDYEIGPDFIKITFQNNSVYTYTEESVGTDNLELMKSLAKRGSGLGSFIHYNVRYNYADKQI